MDSTKLYRPDVLSDKVPTLHPRYQWMKLELEPDDRIVLTSINGHLKVGELIELTDLTEDSVARVILKLVGRGVVLWDDTLPFYEEDELLELLPTFDPQHTNRNAHLDDTDRMLLTLINGRTSVRQMEAALPLSRDRLLASVIRLKLAEVIGIAEPEPLSGSVSRAGGDSATSYPVPPTVAPAPPRVVAPEPVPSAPEKPAMYSPSSAAPAPPPASFADPPTHRANRSSRQDAFEEATRRLLEGKSELPDDFDLGDTPQAPRRPSSGGRDDPPRYGTKKTRGTEKRKRSNEVRGKAVESEAASERKPSWVPKIAMAAVAWVAALLLALAYLRGGNRAPARGPYNTPEAFRGVIELSQVLPRQSGKFYAVVTSHWFQMSSADRKASMQAMAAALKPDSITAIVLTDEDNKIVAEWEDGSLTLHE